MKPGIFLIVVFFTVFTLNLASASTYGVNVYGLQAKNDTINFTIKNTGTVREFINYWVYVNHDVLAQNSIELNASESKKFELSYSFKPGKYEIEVVASTHDLTDKAQLTYCISGYLDNYRCYDDEKQREYQYSDCSSDWINVQHCEHGCQNGQCFMPGKLCGVAIKSFDYLREINESEQEIITLTVKNTGDKDLITIWLYVDGNLKSSHFALLNPNEVITKTFYFYLGKGTHNILLQAIACGSMKYVDSVRATVTVKQIKEITYSISEPKEASMPKIETDIRVPKLLNMSLYEGRAISLWINTTLPQVFNLSVDGIPIDWVNYPAQVEVRGEKEIYLYITPKKLGEYNLTITVEGKQTLQSIINLLVTQAQAKELEKPVFDSDKLLLLAICLLFVVIFIGSVKLKKSL